MTRPDRDAELRRTAAVTCPQDHGENPFGWSEPDDLPPLPTPTTEEVAGA